MKKATAGLIFLAAMSSSPGLQAAEPDEALCRGPYPVLLVTAQECRQHIKQVKSLRSKGQTQALDTLLRQHAELLQARAAVCPCIESKPDVIPAQQLALLETDC